MPIDKRQLEKRKWPSSSFPVGQEVLGRNDERNEKPFFCDDNGQELIPKKENIYVRIPYPADYLKSCYVDKKRVSAFSLPVPPGESAISSLSRDSTNKIYGVTKGKACHLFVCDPYEKRNSVVVLGIVEKECAKSSIVISHGRDIFIGTRKVYGEGNLYSYNLDNVSASIEKIGAPVKGEGISALVMDDRISCIYGLTDRTGTFFIFNCKERSFELKGQVNKEGLFSEVLSIDSYGNVFGGCRWTELFKYDVKRGRLLPLGIKAPSLCGREFYNKIESLIWDEQSRSFYGGTSGDGILFRFCPEEEKMISLGKPLNQPHIRCLTKCSDGCIYGIAGKNCCHLFRYNPGDGDLRDFGVFSVSSPRFWHGYEFDAVVTGEKGTIYFGESDRISHLFIYSTK
ncbi:MAG: hypothetical protein WDA18_05375 [Candidatus Ratteibacteria bacterium]|jgi:hypothetical protein